jgi:restriction system protein
MPIPDFQTIMLPLLEYLNDGKEHTLREAIDSLAARFKLTDADRRELLPSGLQRMFDNRVGWSRTYMKKAGLIDSKTRGHIQITDRGQEALKGNPSRIDIGFLDQYEGFKQFRTGGPRPPKRPPEEPHTPEEVLEDAYQSLKNSLANEMLTQIKSTSPKLFERIVIELLVKMGYGGSRQDAGKAIGGTGDEGIDGIIKEDRLGLDIIYVQAKRWENTVGRPEIQKFAGALQGQRAKKGIFITTANFSKEAQDYASKIDNKIVLISGEELAEFMIDNNIGVSPVSNYEVKRIDLDYFSEE